MAGRFPIRKHRPPNKTYSSKRDTIVLLYSYAGILLYNQPRESAMIIIVIIYEWLSNRNERNAGKSSLASNERLITIGDYIHFKTTNAINSYLIRTLFSDILVGESMLQSSSSFPFKHCLIPSQRCVNGTQLSGLSQSSQLKKSAGQSRNLVITFD